jgi:hypothetical protein
MMIVAARPPQHPSLGSLSTRRIMTPFRTTALVGALVAAAGAEFLIDGGETAGDAGYVAREKPPLLGV